MRPVNRHSHSVPFTKRCIGAPIFPVLPVVSVVSFVESFQGSPFAGGYHQLLAILLDDGHGHGSDLPAFILDGHLSATLIAFIDRNIEHQLAARQCLRLDELDPGLGRGLDFDREVGVVLDRYLQRTAFGRDFHGIAQNNGGLGILGQGDAFKQALTLDTEGAGYRI